MEAVNQFRTKVQQILDKECKVDWGKEGKYWGIISKYDATHPEAPWTIYYPGDGDEENGVFTPDFTEWHVEDEENPKDPFTVRHILTWKDEKPTSLPEPPDDLGTMEFEPILGRREELPHNQSSDSEGSGDKGGDSNENGAESSSEDDEEEGANGSGPRARRPSSGGAMSRQLSVPARLPPKLSARRPSSKPDSKLRRSASAGGLAPGGSQLQGNEQQEGKRRPGRPRKHSLPGGEQPPAKRLRGRTPKNSNAAALAGPGGSGGDDSAAVKDKASRMRKVSTVAPVDGATCKPPVSDALGSGGACGGSAGRSGSAELATGPPKPRRLIRVDSNELDDKHQDEKLPVQKGQVKAAAAVEEGGAGQSPSSLSSDEGGPRDGGDGTASRGSKAARAAISDAAQAQGQPPKAGPSPDGKRVIGTGRPKPLLNEEQLAKRKMSFGTAVPPRAGLLGVVPTARMQRDAAHAGTVKIDVPLAKPTAKATLSKPTATGPGAGNSQSQSTVVAVAAAQSKAAHIAAPTGQAGLAAAVAVAADGNSSAAVDAPVGSAAGSQEAPPEGPSPAMEQPDEQAKAGNYSSGSRSEQQQSRASVLVPSGTTLTPLAALPQPSLPPSLLAPLSSPQVISKVSLPPLPVVSLPPRTASSASLAAAVSQHTLLAPQSASPAAAAATIATIVGNTATLPASQSALQVPLQQDSQQQDSQQLHASLSQSQGYQPGVSSQGSQREPQMTAAGLLDSPPTKGPKATAVYTAVRSAYLPPATASTPVAPALHAATVTAAIVATATLPARPALPATAALAALIHPSTIATASLPAAISTTLPTATIPVSAAAVSAPSTAAAVAAPPTTLPMAGGAAGGGSAAEALAAASNAAISSGATPETAHTDVQQLLHQLLGRALDALTNSQNAIKSTANSAILMAKAVGANRVARGFFSKLQLLGEEVAVLAPEGCTGDATGCERVAAVLAKRLNVFYVMDSMLQRSTKEEAISSWPKWVNSGLQASFRLKVFTEHHLKSVRKVTDVWRKRNLLDPKVLEMADLILREQESMLRSTSAATGVVG
ncbi:hypothetical protein Vretimale_5007, partial [Volvox reticuliferus]